MNNVSYLLALHSINGLGPIRLKNILDYFKDPKLAWEAKESELLTLGIPKPTVELFLQTRKKLDPLSYAQQLQDSNISWVTVFDSNYPKLLSQIYDPPIILYFKGDVLPQEQSLAVVGTRKITGYGKVVTERFTRELVNAGFTIVSGLAKGVDTVAHRVTLENKGRTIAVLASGLNYIFPPENKMLAQKIVESSGALVTEFPPDYPSLAGNFPSRNRIISGLSLATLVTEAASDSGSLITARLSIEQGRDVFAVPGPITSTLSKGPIDLIKQGAKAVYAVQDILDELGVQIKSSKSKVQNLAGLSEEEKQVLECLQDENFHIDEIGRKLNFPSAKISGLLLKMEIAGLIVNLGSGLYAKV